MKVKELKLILEEQDDELEIFAYNHRNLCGNISEIETVKRNTYSTFGNIVPCLIIGFEEEEEDE